MAHTKEISFHAESVKVEHQSRNLSIEVEKPNVEELLAAMDKDDIKKFIAANFKPDEIFDDNDLNEWAIDNDYTKS